MNSNVDGRPEPVWGTFGVILGKGASLLRITILRRRFQKRHGTNDSAPFIDGEFTAEISFILEKSDMAVHEQDIAPIGDMVEEEGLG